MNAATDKFYIRVSEELGRMVRIVAASRGLSVNDYCKSLFSKHVPRELAELRNELNEAEKS